MSTAVAYDAYKRREGQVILTSTGEKELAEAWDYEPEVSDEFLTEEEIDKKQAQLIGVAPSQFVEFAIKLPDKELQKHVNFSFKKREYLRLPYDTPSRRTLYKCGRQVEKSQWFRTLNSLADGRLVEAKDVKVGDELATLNNDGVHMTTGKVVWVSRLYEKPCVRIKTRQGHEVVVALTHPMRRWGEWAEAEKLHVGDRLAAVRRCGVFTNKLQAVDERIRLTAYLIGDGGLSQPTYSFTSLPGAKLDEFLADVRQLGGTYRLVPSKIGKAIQVFLHSNCQVYGWMKEDGLHGHKSADKYIPNWVFGLDRRQTALFLNRLWSTDGHVKKNGPSKYSIEYCSISKILAQEVQALLWKFGIPSKIRENWPSIYKRRGEKKLAYIVRVETQEGVRRFLTDVGALGKVEDVVVPDSGSNNNRDTFPEDVNDLIRQVIDSRGDEGRMGCQAEKGRSLRTAGLRETLKYPPTMEKVRQYVAFFRSDERYDQQLVSQLEGLLSTDLYWDEIVSIEDAGVQDCIDFQVDGTHNFVAEGLVTHNSTLLGNKTLSYCCIINAFNVLYVSPTNQQTKTFSQDRLKEPIETSEILKAWTTSKLSDNVFLKKFINRSQVTLRYAYHNADRCLVGASRVHFVDGSVRTMQELYESLGDESIWSPSGKFLGPRVVSLELDGQNVPVVGSGELTDVISQGRRQVFRVRVEGGAEADVTGNEPLFTSQGWKLLQDLTPGEYVAVPSQAPHGAGNPIPDAEYRLVGYLLGDGHVVEFSNVGLSNGNREVLDDFTACAKMLGAEVGGESVDPRDSGTTTRINLYGGRNGYKTRLRDLGLIGLTPETKRVPVTFFTGNAHQIREFLRAIYSTDGWASTSQAENGLQSEIGYCSNSRCLLVDLKSLLTRFGINSVISRQKKPSTKGAKGAFVLSIRSRKHILRFIEHIGIVGKSEELARVYDALSGCEGRRHDSYDRVAFSYQRLRDYLKALHGLSTHSAWTKYRIQLRPGNVRDSIGREVLKSVAAKLGDEWLLHISESDVGWARIESIESQGEQETFDLTVPGTENFLVDGLFVHNTRGIPADLVLMDEIQDIITDNIPVIEECASHSHYKIFIYSGTPKSYDNAIEHYWTNYSTQNEWVVPCDRHGTPNDPSSWHWNVLGEAHVQPKGLCCDRCGERIDPRHPMAQWATMNPSVKNKLKDWYEGYRIPQLMVPWLSWGEIYDKYIKYPRSQFYNEVLGMSYDSGTRPLTRQDVIDNCNPALAMDENSLVSLKASLGITSPVYAGIDWGCHDEETRILTPRGFTHFRDLTNEDKVAQWDPDTREMTFVAPEVKTVKDWDQPLHHFEGKGLDMMLTHTHRMRVMPKVNSEQSWRTEPCERTVQRGGSVFFVGHVDWRGEERQSFVLPGQPTSPGFQGVEPRTFDMDEWLEFLGYYLSEGGLCFDGERPSCLKMSQRETVNPGKAKRIGDLLQKLFSDSLSTFPNPKTGDINWTLYGKQLWSWALNNVGERSHWKRIPREFLSLSKRQLQILFDAMMLGDGNIDPRQGNNNGYYGSTSKGLCEDFQELCIRLGLRSTLSLHKPEEESRKARWRVSWSTGRDFQYNDSKRTKTVPYNGKVYCCKVPTGYIVTERNGCIAYQGNTGEGSYSVMSLGAYMHGFFQIFYIHRFEGQEIEPPMQLGLIEQLIRYWDVKLVGCDYGGGFDRNDSLSRTFGRQRIVKYQYSQPGQKVKWEEGLNRFLVHRTEVMSDIFNAIKRRDVLRFPGWDQFEDPFAKDMLSIFSEYNEVQRQVQYKHAPDATDDSFHSILLCFLASMIRHPRYDVMNPTQKTGYAAQDDG